MKLLTFKIGIRRIFLTWFATWGIVKLYRDMMVDTKTDGIEKFLDEARNLMRRALAQTALRQLNQDCGALLANGKMLRSRMAWRLGTATQTPYKTYLHTSAAVEMIHAASLLHQTINCISVGSEPPERVQCLCGIDDDKLAFRPASGDVESVQEILEW